jgi:hypothetical protein
MWAPLVASIGPAVVFGDLRVYERAPMRLEALVRSLLVRPH